MAVPVIGSYDGLAGGTCLETVPGTTSGYVPAVDEPAAPCFVTSPETVLLELGGVAVPLADAQLGGTWTGDPIDGSAPGLLRGFLSEADADAVLLPPKLGGAPLSSLLPGGTGSCAPGDDRDVHDGVSGWWFYLNLTAYQVDFVAP